MFNTVCRSCGKTVANSGHVCGGMVFNNLELDPKLQAVLTLAGVTLEELTNMREDMIESDVIISRLVLAIPKVKVLGMDVVFNGTDKARVVDIPS